METWHRCIEEKKLVHTLFFCFMRINALCRLSRVLFLSFSLFIIIISLQDRSTNVLLLLFFKSKRMNRRGEKKIPRALASKGENAFASVHIVRMLLSLYDIQCAFETIKRTCLIVNPISSIFEHFIFASVESRSSFLLDL